jgi:hypothetical protein
MKSDEPFLKSLAVENELERQVFASGRKLDYPLHWPRSNRKTRIVPTVEEWEAECLAYHDEIRFQQVDETESTVNAGSHALQVSSVDKQHPEVRLEKPNLKPRKLSL